MTEGRPLDPYALGEKLGALTTQVANVDRGINELKSLFFQGRDEQRAVNENHDRVIASHETSIKSHEIRIKTQEDRKPPLVGLKDFTFKYWWAFAAVGGGWLNWRFPGLWDEIFSVFNQVKGAS